MRMLNLMNLIPKSKINTYIQKCANKLGVGKDNIIPYSSENAYNRDCVLKIIESDLNFSVEE